MKANSFIVALAIALCGTRGAHGQIHLRPAAIAYQQAQSRKPSYLGEMPSVERVLREVKGTDADDTVARQLGTLLQFNKMIEDMAWELERRYTDALTGDEQRLRAEYMAAFKQLRATVPDKTFRALRGYDIDPNFTQVLLNQFFSPNFRALWEKSHAKEMARLKANAQPQNNIYGAPSANGGGNSAAGASSSGDMASALKGMAKGLMSMGGIAAPTGLLMNGKYKGEGFGVTLDASSATVDCGDLAPLKRKYTVQRNGPQVVVAVENEPKAIALMLRPDGKLAGQGPVTVSGKVQVGTKKVWMRDTRTAETYAGSGYYSDVPIYEPKSVRCTVGALVATGPTATTGADVSKAMSAFGMGSGARIKVTPGLRINGTFVGQGGSIDFDEDSATIKCGANAGEHAYAVEPAGSQIIVRIEGAGTLEIAPGGQLVGQGGIGGCNLGTLALAGGAASNMATTSAGSIPASAAVPATANVAAAAPATPAVARTSAVLTLASGLPTPAGGKNALVGHTFGLSREDFATVLTKAGFHPPTGTSVIPAWAEACKNRSPVCQQGFNAQGAASVATVTLDAGGKATFSAVPPGVYYVFGSTRYGNGHLLWDVRVEVVPGTQMLTLNERNAMPME